MPEHWKLLGVTTPTGLVSVGKTDEMEHQGIDNFVRKLVLFIDQDANK
jgi:hypothetical protein